MIQQQKDLLRGEMLQNRSFLFELYNSKRNTNLAVTCINSANEHQRTVLWQVLNAVALGYIPMRTSDLRFVGKKRLSILHSKFKETYLCISFSFDFPAFQTHALNYTPTQAGSWFRNAENKDESVKICLLTRV